MVNGGRTYVILIGHAAMKDINFHEKGVNHWGNNDFYGQRKPKLTMMLHVMEIKQTFSKQLSSKLQSIVFSPWVAP